jgi:acetoacetyl-CoA synthetase
MASKKDCMVGFGILPTDVYFHYTTVSEHLWYSVYYQRIPI